MKYLQDLFTMLFFQIGFAFVFGIEEIKPNSKLAVLFIVLAIIFSLIPWKFKKEPTTQLMENSIIYQIVL
jgi:hypothetical protein